MSKNSGMPNSTYFEGKSTGPAYASSVPKWPDANSGRGSLIVVTPHDNKSTTNPMGACIFPNSDQTRGGVAVSDDPATCTFGWTQESKSFTVTLDGSYDIEHVEREIAMRFKLDDPDKDGLFIRKASAAPMPRIRCRRRRNEFGIAPRAPP